MDMQLTVSAWVWVIWVGGVGGAVSAWFARQNSALPTFKRLGPQGTRLVGLGQLGHIGVAAVTAAVTAWMLGALESPVLWGGVRAIPSTLGFFWVGLVTAGWAAAEHDKRVLRLAVCRAATAPAAHPDTIEALAHASPAAVYETVQSLVPPYRPLHEI